MVYIYFIVNSPAPSGIQVHNAKITSQKMKIRFELVSDYHCPNRYFDNLVF